MPIYSGSQLVVNTVARWANGWKRKGWCKSNSKPPENIPLESSCESACMSVVSSMRLLVGFHNCVKIMQEQYLSACQQSQGGECKICVCTLHLSTPSRLNLLRSSPSHKRWTANHRTRASSSLFSGLRLHAHVVPLSRIQWAFPRVYDRLVQLNHCDKKCQAIQPWIDYSTCVKETFESYYVRSIGSERSYNARVCVVASQHGKDYSSFLFFSGTFHKLRS